MIMALSAALAGGFGVLLAGGLGTTAALRVLAVLVAVELGPGSIPALLAVFGPEGGAVGQDGVDLPPFAVGGAGDPELVLPGVAAGGVPLVDGCQAGLGEPGLLGFDGAGVGDLDAEVVEAAALAGVLQQDQLERRLGDGEVGVAGPYLRGFGAEQLGVEGDGFCQIVDVEGELDAAGHGYLRDIDGCLCL